jgi:plasmid replication initiation protein
MSQLQVYGGDNLGELQVSMSHAIARASLGLSLVEMRIIYIFIAKFNGKKRMVGVRNEPLLLEDRQVKVTAAEYAETFSIKKNLAYRDLKNSAEQFLKRYWTLKLPDGKVRKGNWLDMIEYKDGDGYVTATFTETSVPHIITTLGQQYTKLRLKSSASLVGKNAWGVWLLLSLFSDPTESKKKRNRERFLRITLDDFRHALEIPKSYRFVEIRTRIIEPALEQILEINKIKVDFEALPTKGAGRAITTLEFKFTPHDALTLFGAPYSSKDRLSDFLDPHDAQGSLDL